MTNPANGPLLGNFVSLFLKLSSSKTPLEKPGTGASVENRVEIKEPLYKSAFPSAGMGQRSPEKRLHRQEVLTCSYLLRCTKETLLT